MRTGTSIEYYAPCTLGVEPALERELIHLGALEVESQPGGVRFRGDRRLGYTANLWLRSAIRVQELLDRFPAASPEELYKGAQRIDWAELMSVDDTLLIDSTVADSAIRHSKYAALVVKDGIVDWFRERLGRRPSVDRLRPTLPMKLVIRNNRASLWRNLSGPSLHKRGWRPIQVKSPLNESTAAGLLLMTGWDAKSTLVDPMCGSGTFVIEAALLAADRAPGRNRAFAFERWPDFDAALWESIKSAADDRAKASLPFAIQGADRHGGAIEIANKSAREAGVSDLVRFDRRDARDFAPREQPSIVVVNPPFGKRVGEGEGLVDSWRDLGNFLHESAVGAAAWVLCGNKDLTRHLGLKSNERHVVRNGQIDCRWLRYDVGAQAGHVARGERPAPWVTRFASRVPKQGRVLDLACGTGRHVALFTEQG
ncbi:MAG: hypothetical protein QGG14_09210, partial [Planctomycetota bacterium]|nr:hypothetical protein [Planctomycetota bacterium]